MKHPAESIILIEGGTWHLDTENQQIEEICIGLSWDLLKKRYFFGLLSKSFKVDLDVSLSLFDSEKQHLDTVFYGNLGSYDGAIRHKGDDSTGDSPKTYKAENEVIEFELKKISPEVESIFIFSNLYSNTDFSEVPFVRLSVYRGLYPSVKKSLASFTIHSNPRHKFNTCLVLLEMRRDQTGWVFKAIGESYAVKKIKEIQEILQTDFL